MDEKKHDITADAAGDNTKEVIDYSYDDSIRSFDCDSDMPGQVSW